MPPTQCDHRSNAVQPRPVTAGGSSSPPPAPGAAPRGDAESWLSVLPPRGQFECDLPSYGEDVLEAQAAAAPERISLLTAALDLLDQPVDPSFEGDSEADGGGPGKRPREHEPASPALEGLLKLASAAMQGSPAPSPGEPLPPQAAQQCLLAQLPGPLANTLLPPW